VDDNNILKELNITSRKEKLQGDYNNINRT
jgi:hypothetical protein